MRQGPSARNLMFEVCHQHPYHGKVEQILHVMKVHMINSLQLAGLHFNESSSCEHVTIQKGDARYI